MRIVGRLRDAWDRRMLRRADRRVAQAAERWKGYGHDEIVEWYRDHYPRTLKDQARERRLGLRP